jgi:uncharacterized membrane protein YhhN
MKPVLYPIPLLVVTVTLLIRAELLEKRRQVYVFKPLSTLLVIATALLSLLEPAPDLTYTVGVVIGLLFSLGGDVALMFKESRKAFMLGLVLFLLAHVAYTVVFILLGRFSAWDLLSVGLLLAAGAGFYTLLRPNLGSMRGPVIAYMVVISLMVNRAAATLVSPAFTPGQAAMILSGAVLFYLSDVMLAANRFWRPWRYNRISLAFYYGGQLLIALAAGYFG